MVGMLSTQKGALWYVDALREFILHIRAWRTTWKGWIYI